MSNDKKIGKFHILLADDDEDDRQLFADALKDLKLNNKLSVFTNGTDLMDYLNTTEDDVPHILFLDLNMPCKKGLECLKEIRANSKFNDLSIAIYSTSDVEKDIEDSFTAGANVYIKKPDSHEKLKKAIHDVVNINWQYHKSGLNMETFFFTI